jgi:L-gulonolactone oxidase
MLGKYKAITWPLEFRVVAPDSSYLGMNQGRQTITLSLHQAAGLEFEPFFRDVEAVARNHGGRPHWGKMHFLTADQLAELYPDWQAFQKVRQQLDPTGVFQTPYLQKILG